MPGCEHSCHHQIGETESIGRDCRPHQCCHGANARYHERKKGDEHEKEQGTVFFTDILGHGHGFIVFAYESYVVSLVVSLLWSG